MSEVKEKTKEELQKKVDDVLKLFNEAKIPMLSGSKMQEEIKKEMKNTEFKLNDLNKKFYGHLSNAIVACLKDSIIKIDTTEGPRFGNFI